MNELPNFEDTYIRIDEIYQFVRAMRRELNKL